MKCAAFCCVHANDWSVEGVYYWLSLPVIGLKSGVTVCEASSNARHKRLLPAPSPKARKVGTARSLKRAQCVNERRRAEVRLHAIVINSASIKSILGFYIFRVS